MENHLTRYFLQIAYKGTSYAGWQAQNNAKGVQSVLEDCLSKLLKSHIELVGSGRTDGGVHCTKQFAHFDCENIPFSEKDFLHKINAFLPKDIAVDGFFPVTNTAHARFDAVKRSYQYVIVRKKSPFFFENAAQLYKNLDISGMNEAAKLLKGENDFTSFCKLHSQNETNLCNVSEALFAEKSPFLLFNISANRFLRGMVRLIVGTLLDVGAGKLSPDDFARIL